MIDYQTVQEFCFEYLTLPKVKDNGFPRTILGRCPFCGDSRTNPRATRLNVTFFNDDKCIYHCFRCGAKGNFIKLYSFINNISYSEAYKKLNTFDAEHIKRSFKKYEIDLEDADDFIPNFNSFIKLDCLSETANPKSEREEILLNKLKDFKKKRKIPVPLYIAKKGLFENRIIIPVFDKNNVIYFQGRSLNKHQKPKYLNPSVEKDNIIVNENYFKTGKSIIVTEGLADAFSIGLQGTCPLGINISDSFISKLYKYTDNIIIALDNDSAGMEKLKNILEESKYSNKLRYFLMPKKYKDIKDFNQLMIENEIPQLHIFVEDNSFNHFQTRLKLKTEMWRDYPHENSQNGKGILYNKRRKSSFIHKNTKNSLDKIRF